MAGGIYTALSGMRTRLESLDRLAADIANSSTAGYKTERAGTAAAERPSFGAALESAIDVSDARARIDLRSGTLATTGRELDLAIDGSGFFVVETPGGNRYTRNGSFMRREDGILSTADGEPVLGESGPITLRPGAVDVGPDATVRQAGAVVGKLRVVAFDDSSGLVRESAVRLRNDGADATPVARPSVKSGSLEQSNVSVVERLVDLTTASRNFEGMQRALSVLVNDVDSRAIAELGRR